MSVSHLEESRVLQMPDMYEEYLDSHMITHLLALTVRDTIQWATLRAFIVTKVLYNA